MPAIWGCIWGILCRQKKVLVKMGHIEASKVFKLIKLGWHPCCNSQFMMKTTKAKPSKYNVSNQTRAYEVRRKSRLPFYVAAIATTAVGMSFADTVAAEQVAHQSPIIEFGETVSVDSIEGVNSLHVVTTVRPYDHVELKVYDKDGRELKEYFYVSEVATPTSSKLNRLAAQLKDEPRELNVWDYICMKQPKFPKDLKRGLWVSKSGELSIGNNAPAPQTVEKMKASTQVLSPLGCWVGYTLEPEHRGASEKAHQLKGIVQGVRDEVLFDHFGVGG